jgi:ABC-type multidrug transport system fused ATPase/permease subunit
MDEVLNIVAALAVALTAIFTFFKIVNEVVLSRSIRHREDYQFTKNYIEDLYDPDVHTFVLEKGFRALTNELYSIDEIKVLLSYSEPTTALHLRSNSKKLIEFDSSSQTYQWQGRWANDCLRKLSHKTFIIFYAVFAFIVIYPLLQTIFASIELYTLPISTSIILGSLSLFLLLKYIIIEEATDFMSLTDKQRTNDLEREAHE